MPEIVPPQMLIPECCNDLIPMRSVPRDTGSNPPTPWSTEQTRIGFAPSDRIEPVRDELPNFFHQRDRPGTVALGAFVRHAAGEGVV